jgi:SpoU rRNA methylase family enzyme
MALAGVHQPIQGLQEVTGKILFLNDLSDALDALSVPALP